MFTVKIVNHALRNGRWRGTFDTVDAADRYARDEAARSRSFVEFQVCHGTPRSPGIEVGPVYKGGD